MRQCMYKQKKYEYIQKKNYYFYLQLNDYQATNSVNI